MKEKPKLECEHRNDLRRGLCAMRFSKVNLGSWEGQCGTK